jgi:surfactin synthase thioesterase subunit
MQMNLLANKLAKEEPRFKGKVSIIGHSLGTVITYDLLTR